ncbi:hypothetical protein F511_18456 [Dorcoceras hygrometricum]|uniref:DNA glycosylase superfamily protein n=1 Tax=Dorcoceras hygrometricum TaxID=472368 RepID=A0A2Z7ADV7_9LAMI|nr:hypothetical protein F511_18456 [Dorcoceras hygrometricum]
MSKLFIKKQDVEKIKSIWKEKEKPNTKLLSKRSKKIYPFGLHRTLSPLSLSSLSLSLSHNSTDSSSLTDSSASLEQKISFAIRLIAPAARREAPLTKINVQHLHADHDPTDQEGTRRCNWITETSDEVYVQFHDKCWGVPVYDDKHSRNVPLRSPKAETMSKDLMRHGFRLVGPVIVYSFMQAAGMTIDHLVCCFRYKECVDVAERPWKHA